MAEALKPALRGEDLNYRFGGELFVLLMESNACAGVAANAVLGWPGAIRVFIALAEYAIVRPTVVIGVAQSASEEPLQDLVERG